MTNKNELATTNELERALRFNHLLISINRHLSRESSVYTQALLGLLLEKGLIDADEFELKAESFRKNTQNDPQVMLSKAPDKYACSDEVIIDCSSRLHLCKATCCTFRFFLTPQDLDEGIVKWDYGNPYWVRQRDGGYCSHCNEQDFSCKIHPQRPYTCRMYDCRVDKRIWLDFENRIPNPKLSENERDGK